MAVNDRDSIRVLIATTDEALGDSLFASMVTHGFEVSIVGAAQRVLAALERGGFCALVVDGELPTTSGFELAKRVRENAAGDRVDIILLTGSRWTASQKVAAIQQIGLLDVLPRPVDPMQITEIIATELASRLPTANEPLADPASHDEQRHVEREARAVRAGPIKQRGNLSATPFPRLLHTLYRQSSNGALFLLRENVKKIIYFQDGHPVYVKSNLLSECLGKVLVREGMISEKECQASLEKMRETRRQQGTVLIEMGAISPQNLVVALELQLQTKLLDIFSWSRGEFLLKGDATAPSEAIRLEMGNASLIAEGIRKMWPEERIRAAIAPYLDSYLMPASDPNLRFQEVLLDDLEQALRDEMVGAQTLRQLVANSPLADGRALTVAYVLIVAGIVEAFDEPQRGDSSPRCEDISEEEHVRQRLAAELHSLRSRDHFGVLGVSVGSSDAEVEQAYSALARQYHPDRYRSCSAETKGMVREIFGLLFSAYEEIASAGKRRAFQDHLETGELEDVSDSGHMGLMAERVAGRAQRLIELGQWAKAAEELSAGIERCGDIADLQAMLGWVLFNTASDDGEVGRQAILHLRRAIALHPGDDRAYLYLGRVYAKMGKRILAEKQFEKALQCNPESAEALQELQIQKELRPPRRSRSHPIRDD